MRKLLIASVLLFAAISLIGCAAMDSAAAKTSTFTQKATTDLSTPAVDQIAAAVPYGVDVQKLSIAILGTVGLAAGAYQSWRKNQAKAAVGEVVSDIAPGGNLQPNVPYSPATTAIVTEMSGIMAAAPHPVSTVPVITAAQISPIVAAPISPQAA